MLSWLTLLEDGSLSPTKSGGLRDLKAASMISKDHRFLTPAAQPAALSPQLNHVVLVLPGNPLLKVRLQGCPIR